MSNQGDYFSNNQLNFGVFRQNSEAPQLEQEGISEEIMPVPRNSGIVNDQAEMAKNTMLIPFNLLANQSQHQPFEGIAADKQRVEQASMYPIQMQPNCILPFPIHSEFLDTPSAQYRDSRRTTEQDFPQIINGYYESNPSNQLIPDSHDFPNFLTGQPNSIPFPCQPQFEQTHIRPVFNSTSVPDLPPKGNPIKFGERHSIDENNSRTFTDVNRNPTMIQHARRPQYTRENDCHTGLNSAERLSVSELQIEADYLCQVNRVTSTPVETQQSIRVQSGAEIVLQSAKDSNVNGNQQFRSIQFGSKWKVPSQFACKMHPSFSTKIYCLTHSCTICGVCASEVCGTHGACKLVPKRKVPSPLLLNIIRQLDRILKNVDLCMQKAGVRNIWEVCRQLNLPLLNCSFKNTKNFQKTDRIMFIFDKLNELLLKIGMGRDSMNHLKYKLAICEELFHLEPKLYLSKPFLPQTKNITEMRQLKLIGQGICEVVCGYETKFYMQFLTKNKKHRCHIPVDQVTIKAVMMGGQCYPVQVKDCKMPGTLEATYTCFVPGVVTLKIQVGSDPNERDKVSLVKMNRYRQMEVKSYLGCDMFNKPWGICVSRLGEIFVADRCNHNIKVFTKDFLFRRVISEHGQEHGQLCRPTGIAIDREENLVVCDKDNHRIQVFTLNGKFLRSSQNSIDMQVLTYPWAVAVNSKNEYIVTHSKFKVTIMTSNFAHLTDLYAAPPGRNPELQFNPRGICVDYLDQMYFSDFENGLIYRATREHPYFEEFFASCEQDGIKFGSPSTRIQSITMDSRSNFIVADSKTSRIEFRSYAGALLGELKVDGKAMAVAELPDLQGYYVVVLDECKFGLAVVGPKSMTDISSGLKI